MTELTKEKKIALGVTIAIAVVFVFIIIIVIVVIIKRKKKAEEEETKEGFETGKETIPTIILNAFMNSVLTKDVRNLSSKVTNTTIFAIQRSINKARKDLDTAVETFKKNCAAKGIKDFNKAIGVQKLMVLTEKSPVMSKYNMVVNLYKALGNVVSKVDKGKTTITEIMVPELNMSNINTAIANQDTKLTIEPAIKSYIMTNCNYMEVPKYKYVQASLGQKRKVNGREETIWHESSYNYKPKLEEDVQPLLKKVETVVEEVKPQIIEEVKFSKVEEVKPVTSEIKIAEAKPQVIEEVKPIVNEVKIAEVEEVKPNVNEVKIAEVEEVKPEVVVSNYVEPIRVAETQSASDLKTESNIIEAKVENPKAETVQAAVVNKYVDSKEVAIDFKSNNAQSDTVRLPAGAICTNDEQEVKFLKALRALK